MKYWIELLGPYELAALALFTSTLLVWAAILAR